MLWTKWRKQRWLFPGQGRPMIEMKKKALGTRLQPWLKPLITGAVAPPPRPSQFWAVSLDLQGSTTLIFFSTPFMPSPYFLRQPSSDFIISIAIFFLERSRGKLWEQPRNFGLSGSINYLEKKITGWQVFCHVCCLEIRYF